MRDTTDGEDRNQELVQTVVPFTATDFARNRRTEAVQRIEPGKLTLAIIHAPPRHPLAPQAAGSAVRSV